ncbi:MAG: type II secretion system protein [Planctomycetota bacterium]|jgi:prepilin-type N-terminal cleavage/methylation domain-containing protein
MIHDIRYTTYEPRATSGGRPIKPGWTIVEMLIVVAIIAILAAMVIGMAGRISAQSNEQLLKNTFALLNAALTQFSDYGYNYKFHSSVSYEEIDFYRSLDFPVDCNYFPTDKLEQTLEHVTDKNIGIDPTNHDINYSGGEALYFFLSQVPECRQTLERIDKSLITNEGTDGVSMRISIDGQDYPLLRIIDPWGQPLQYDYYEEEPPPLGSIEVGRMEKSKRVFPVITSAGPDGEFGTADDIKSR